MTDKLVMDYVVAERHRCMDLCEAIHDDTPFLIYCIDNTYTVEEIAHARRRFDEMQPLTGEPVNIIPFKITAEPEDIEDLL